MTGPARILVIRTDRLGDLVLTLPVFSELRRRFPAAHLALLAGEYAGAIAEGSPVVDEIIPYDRDGQLIPFGAMRARLREGNFGAAVIVHPTLRVSLLAYVSRIPLRIGTGYRFYSFLFTRRIYTHRKSAERHEVEYNVELLVPLGGPAVPAIPLDAPLVIPHGARDRVSALLEQSGVRGRFVIIHPGSGGSAREWPPERFGALAGRIARGKALGVVVTGTQAEAGLASSVARAAGGGALSLAGMFGVRELAALIGKSSLLIANSTGPLHVAVALGTPVVGLYPSLAVMAPRRWGPYTDRARVLVAPARPDCPRCNGRGNGRCSCMEAISVDAAYAAASELLEEAAFRGGQAAYEH